MFQGWKSALKPIDNYLRLIPLAILFHGSFRENLDQLPTSLSDFEISAMLQHGELGQCCIVVRALD